MTLLLLLALAAGAVWLLAWTPVRVAGAVVLFAQAPKAPPVALVPVLALLLAAAAGWLVWRAMAPCGWRLIVTTTRTRPASNTA